MIKLIDVTLRDGGYNVDFHFANDLVKEVLTELDRSGLDYIEVGYRNGSFKPIPNVGVAGLCGNDYLELCRSQISRAKLTVMLHPKNITATDIIEMKSCGVDTIRICFPATNPELGFQTLNTAKEAGLECFVNITRTSQYSRKKITEWVREIAKHEPQGIYLADSNGSLTPEEVGNMYASLRQQTTVPLGFHAHDNLFLAQANAVAAMNNGASYLDASLHGLGKGAGNLRTEGIVSFLCSKYFGRYDLCSVLNSANIVKRKLIRNEDVKAKDIIMGVFDLSQDDAIKIGQVDNTESFYQIAKKFKAGPKHA